MATAFALEALKREKGGKGASRRLRRLEKALPAIIYGANKPPQPISIILKDFIKQLENEAFFAHILDISIDGVSEKVVLKDIQRHPVTRFPIHADFMRVDSTHKITMKVPLHFINESTCIGVKNGGGTVNRLRTELDVSCLAQYLPEYIEVDLANLDVGDSLHISEIKLPDNVESVDLIHGEEHDLALVQVLAPKGSGSSDDDVDAADSEGGKPEK